MGVLLLIGRILFSLIFIGSGINHITKAKDMIPYAQMKKLPLPGLLVPLSGLVVLAGAASIILGLWIDLGALLIGGFCLLSGVIFHNFWAADAASKQTEMISFLKNVSIAGGALIIVAIVNKNNGIDLGPVVSHAHQVLFTKN
jgi:uncharacterized membrane protein YphA (DoxX/SURF4 family)